MPATRTHDKTIMPPPPRSKLYGKSGKHKTINQSRDSPAASTSVQLTNAVVAAPGQQSTDSEADRQLELELCWCIQTLEASLDSGKLNAKAGWFKVVTVFNQS